MAIGKDRERIFVTVSTDMAKRIDRYCESMGLSRSAFCAHAIGQTVMSMDKSFGVLENLGSVLAEGLKAED